VSTLLTHSIARRKRHWNQLMEVTGQSFDMDPKTFTLQAMFAMQLHKFAEEIGKITNAAVKELTIESELKKLAEAWREQRFDVFKYIKVSRAGQGHGCSAWFHGA
jgi:dynein heavy chain, axonemal